MVKPTKWGSSHDEVTPSEATSPHLDKPSEMLGRLKISLQDFDFSEYQTQENFYVSFLRGTLLVLERSEDGGWSFGYVDGRADKG